MKKFIQLKITVTLLFLFFTFISTGQISLSQEEIIKQYGTDYQEGIFDDNLYLLFTNPVSPKTSDSFIYQKIMFFKKANDGNAYCFMFQLIKPISEWQTIIDIYNRDINPLGYLHWVNPADGVNYRIEQSKGVCLITAWLGDEKREIPETSFF